MRELASGVDALYLSGHGYLSKGFLARLEEERLFADRTSVPVPFELGPFTLGLCPHGWGKYRYCLDHETGRVGFTASRRLPSVRIQPRAEFLHAVGPEETVRHFADLVRPFVEGSCAWRASTSSWTWKGWSCAPRTAVPSCAGATAARPTRTPTS